MTLRAFLLPVLMSGGLALAQTVPPRVAPLPDASGVPQPPAITRLPGPDPRECGPTKWSALCAEGRWAQFSTIKLRVTARGFVADYTTEQAVNLDIHTTYREEAGKHRRGGEIVIFSEQAFAYRSRDAFPDPGSIIDYMMSSPIMLSRLTALLLDEGVLGPPSDVTKPRSIQAGSATRYIRTPAPRTAALYAPPWKMTGTVRPAGPNEVEFSLKLDYHPVDAQGKAQAKTDSVTLQGVVSYAPMRATLPDSFDLTGWKLLRDDQPLAGVATLAEARSAAGP